jgi:drug/metabolite transporter (DMT)-like permease
MSKGRDFSDFSVQTLCIGIGSGLCFAITSLLVREASLELDNLPFIHRAAWVLLMVIGTQCFLLLMYLGIFRRATLWAMWQRIGLTFRVSLCSFLASLGWFSAMSMQSVPIVKTLGQIEIIFSMLISAYFFKEKLARAEHLGIVLVVIAEGSGMIHPNMATMLAFITCDASISSSLLQKALSEEVETSFNQITVDGDTSTNDMVLESR